MVEFNIKYLRKMRKKLKDSERTKIVFLIHPEWRKNVADILGVDINDLPKYGIYVSGDN